MAVDTLAYVISLEGAGVDRRVAEAHLVAMLNAVIPKLATKTDLERVEQRLERKIDALDPKLDGKIDKLDEKMRRMFVQSSLGTLLGVLAIGGLLIRFAK